MWTFEAMNTTVSVAAPHLIDSAEHAFAAEVADRFAMVERRFSRFLPDSELALLNRTEIGVISAEMIDLLRACRRHVDDTGGLFDPTVGTALVAAGYDRSFAPGVLDREHVGDAPPRARFADLVIDEAARVVRRPADVQLDFGGFLKGRTVDRAAAAAPTPSLIDAGGDMVLRGAGPDGDGWLVDIEDPDNPERVLATLCVRDRALATSAPKRRCWRRGPGHAHHLIDPRTGLPSSSDLAQVTMLAPTAEQADVLAKTVFLLGAREARRFVAARPELAVVLIHRDGTLEIVGDVDLVDERPEVGHG
jgi:thiamine biosynthesis lipoprotein